MIWAAAGHPAAVFSTTYDELLAMTGATEIEVDVSRWRSGSTRPAPSAAPRVADLDAAGVDYTVRRYLDDPPTRAELEGVLARARPRAVGHRPRQGGAPRRASTCPRDADHRDDWLDGLAAHPRAIQRPIITAADGTTVVGRDPTRVELAIAARARRRLPRLATWTPCALVFSSGWASG